MPEIEATTVVSAPPDKVFGYLRRRYESPTHQEVSRKVKGYVPGVVCVREEENRLVEFEVAGRDPILKIPMGGWKWKYELVAKGDAETEVRILYRWPIVMSLLGAGTTKHQAANEICETTMALDALGAPRN